MSTKPCNSCGRLVNCRLGGTKCAKCMGDARAEAETEPSDNVLRPVNFELLRELNKADEFVKHFLGTMRCARCGNECQVLMVTPLWAAHPPAGVCQVDGCKGNCLFIAPLDYEHGEDFLYRVINPSDR